MAEKTFIVNDTSWCEVCNQPFNPFDMNSPNGEYLESCEARSKNNGPFPADLPKSFQSNPHACCSLDCEQSACDDVRVSRIEHTRMVQEGVIEDTPSLESDRLGSYSL